MTAADQMLHPAENHVIAYAYPASEAAHRAGFAGSGCFYLEAGGSLRGFNTYGESLGEAVVRGSAPARFSLDHPLNRHSCPRWSAIDEPLTAQGPHTDLVWGLCRFRGEIDRACFNPDYTAPAGASPFG